MAMFTRLANAVIKHKKKIVVIWIIAVVLSAPLFMQVNKILAYEETKLMPAHIEAARASDITKEEFPTGFANSTVIVVIQADDVTSPEVKEFSRQLRERVRGDAKIQYLVAEDPVMDVYTIYQAYMNAMAKELNPAVYELEDQTNGTAFLFYGLGAYSSEAWSQANASAQLFYGTGDYVSMTWEQVNASCMMFYGTGSYVAQAWNQTNLSNMMFYGTGSYIAQAWNQTNLSNMMFYGTADYVSDAWQQTNMSNSMFYGVTDYASQTWFGANSSAHMLFDIPGMHMQNWLTEQAMNPLWAVDQWDNASYNDTMLMLPSYFAAIGANASVQAMLGGYYGAFFQNWSATQGNAALVMNPPARANDSVNTSFGFWALAIPDPVQLGLMDSVRGNFTVINAGSVADQNGYTYRTLYPQFVAQNMSAPELAMFMGYFDLWFAQWNLTFGNASLAGATYGQRAEAAVSVAGPMYVGMLPYDNETKNMTYAMLASFNITTWDSVQAQNGFVYGMVKGMMAQYNLSADMLAMFMGYYDLFFSQWNATFANATLDNSTRVQRAEAAVAGAAPIYVASMPYDNETRNMTLAMVASFNLTTWDNVSAQNAFAYGTIRTMLSQYNISADELAIFLGYYDPFFAQWNATFANATLANATAEERAQSAVSTAAPAYIAMMGLDNVSLNMTKKMLAAFDIYSWGNLTAQNNFTYATMREMFADYNVSADELQKLYDYYDLFFARWNGTFSNTTLDNATAEERAQSAVSLAAPGFIATMGLDNESLNMTEKMLSSFNIYNWQNVTVQNGFTYDTMREMFGDYNVSADQLQKLYDYYDLFFARWNVTFANATLDNATRVQRAEVAISQAAPAYIATMGLESDARNMTNDMLGRFNLSNWANVTVQNSFAYDAIAPELADADIATDMKGKLYDYLGLFFRHWNATFSNSTFKDSTKDERAAHSIALAGPEQIRAMNLGEEAANITTQLFNSFNLSNWNSTSHVHNVSVEILSTIPMPDPVPAAFIEQVYALGDNASDEAIEAFTWSVVNNGTLGSYPIKLPSIVVENFIDPANHTMLVTIGFEKDTGFEANGIKPVPVAIDEIKAIVADIKAQSGYTFRTYVSGDAAISNDMEISFGESAELYVTVILLFVLTGIFFRSFVTPFVSLGAMAMALGIAQAAVFLIGFYVIGIHYAAASILMTVLLGAGTDYSIFLLARYREERMKGASREDGVRRSIEWAGESITTSGIAVVISFASLSIATFDLVKTIGWIVSIGVVIALLMALTFVPAIILLAGNKVFWPSGNRWKNAKERLTKTTYFSKSARFSIKHAKAIIIAAMLISIPTTYVYFTSDTSFDFIAVMPQSEGKDGMGAMTEGFGAGKIMPTSIIVVFPWRIYDGENFSASVLDSLDYMCSALRSMDGVRQVYSVTRPQGAPIDYRNLSDLSAGIKAQREGEMLQYVGESNASVLVKVVLQDEPFSQAALGMVPALRARVITLKGEDWNLRNADIYVGGSSATMHDIKSTLDADFVYMAILVIIGIFVILMLVLGSILLPLRAILTIALSISWTLAVTVLLFQNVLGKPVLWLIPIVLFVILMGLGMDYDIFLITRIREEVVAGKTDEEATVIAVERTGGIITACGIIMAGAFGSMMLSGMGMLQQMGFALSFAILLDAMVVRTYLVPSIMVVAKKWNWWAPGRLQRVDEDKIRAAREAERARQQAEAERIKAMGN